MKYIYKHANSIALLLVSFLLVNNSYADTYSYNYHCKGTYNTGAVYDHLYEIKKGKLGDTLIWGGGEFKILHHVPNIIYAVKVDNVKTEVIFIYKDTLKVEFISVFPHSLLFANGQCKRV